MAHLGVFCLPMPSHMNLFMALGKLLASRGHRITFFAISDHEQRLREAGFGFELLEPRSVPIGTLGQMMREMATLSPLETMRLQGKFDELRYHGILQGGPQLVQRAQLDGLIVDQAEACSGSVADYLGIPWVSVCNGLCLNTEPGVPPFLTSWGYSRRPLAIFRNRLAYAGIRFVTRSTQKLINWYRTGWQLAPLTRMDDAFSPFAQICQSVRELDFPREHLPGVFHYVGPIRGPHAAPITFPWERLDGRPLIYASLGTVVNRHRNLYTAIAEACTGLDAQLVLSLGGADGLQEGLQVPAGAIVVTFAPQRELLARARLTVTHAGLNTTLESLENGVPLVAIPIAFEQPAIAARIRWSGTGESVQREGLQPKRLRAVIEKVLHEPSYSDAAQTMKNALAQSGGAAQAADIIEAVVRTGKPVAASI